MLPLHHFTIMMKNLKTIFYRSLKQNIPDILGLEIPFFGSSIHQFGDDYLINMLNHDWKNVITCVPASVYALKKNCHFGLASDNKNSRLLALETHRKANSILHKINDKKGFKSIISVHIATAPSVPKKNVASSLDSLKKSIEELLKWDWDGADLLIEHCDSFSINNQFQKGFLSIDDELEILNFFKQPKLGMALNWARSVIEGRNIKTIIEHIQQAKKNNLLKGFIFSGTTINDHYYGSWFDLHTPFAKIFNIEHYEKNSLLTMNNLYKTLKVIDIESINYIGVKLLPLPQKFTDIKKRVGINKDAIFVLNKMLDDFNSF